MSGALPRVVAPRLPFFYGWLVLFSACCAGFARQGGAVATLSIFVDPMTREFGWSRAAISGAVSFGGLVAAAAVPPLGSLLDRTGARLVLCLAVLTTGAANLLLSLTNSLAMFYVLFCIARTNFAGPFDLGIYSAVNNWFVARRTLATGIATVAQMSGLVCLPLIAEAAMAHSGWRVAWSAIGITVLAVGFIPTWLFMVRRPEDIGLVPDRHTRTPISRTRLVEPHFSRGQALRTPAFWLLCLFALTAYPVQAGVSLHQAPYLIERGLSPSVAAAVVSTFSFMSGVASLGFGFFPRTQPIRYAMAFSAAALGAGSFAMLSITAAIHAYFAAGLFGLGVGGLLTLLPIAWADYFGRASFGAIRGIALSIQVLAQALGPLVSGALRDWSGSYRLSLLCFVALSSASVLIALLARQPIAPPHRRAG